MMSLSRSLAAGILLGIGFIVPALWPLVFGGVAFTIWSLYRISSYRLAFVFGWLLGCVLYGLSFYAIWWQTLPLDWLGFTSSSLQYVIVGGSYAVTVCSIALAMGLFCVCFKFFSTASWSDAFYAPALWVVCEWGSAWWFSIEQLGRGSGVGPHFTLHFLGNLLANNTLLLQGAWIGGVYALSACAVLIGFLLYRFAEAPRSFLLLSVSILLMSLVWISTAWLPASYPPLKKGPNSIRVAVVSTANTPVLFSGIERNTTVLSSIRSIVGKTSVSSIVVFPEGVSFSRSLWLEVGEDGAREELFHAFGTSSETVLVESESVRDERGALRGRMKYLNVKTGVSEFRDKQFLLPMGEYVPYVYVHLIAFLGGERYLIPVLSYRGFTAATSSTPISVGGVNIGSLFCDETMSPILYSSLAAQGAGVFINAASYSWFHGSQLVPAQMKNVAKVRAVESRRWYVQASDSAPALIIDAYGRVVAETSLASDALVGDIPVRSDTTPYVLFGAWIPTMLTLILLVLGVRNIRSKC